MERPVTQAEAPGKLDALNQLLKWWEAELDETRATQLRERSARPWTERLEHGHAVTGLTFCRREREDGSNVRLWFRCEQSRGLMDRGLRPGYPVLLWPAREPMDIDKPPPEAKRQRGTIFRVTGAEIALRFPRRYKRFLENDPLCLEREDSDVTFERGAAAVRVLIDEPRALRMRTLFFGDAIPRFAEPGTITLRDNELDGSQRRAVEMAVRALDVTLVHGPPGTGKTRTLVEIVRQALLLRRRILVTAPSHVAVDNMARRLAECGVKVLRLGAAKKMAPDLKECSLQHKMAALPEWAEAKVKFESAKDIADGRGRRRANPRQRVSELRRDAHRLRDLARAKVLRRSRVVCCTAAGVDAVPLGDDNFDLVILDEATQAPDPVALSALQRGGVLVLAGDPQQLPPTVLSQKEDAKAGLSSTLFERSAARWPAESTTMLTTQYRMSESLMAFPSAAHYEGRLEAGEGNRQHRLGDLIPAAVLSERDGRPTIVIDTSALGHTESFDEHESSYFNDCHRKIVATELERLLKSGVDVKDIAAICPYASQTQRLRLELASLVTRGLELGTVDGFQGREKEVVIVDLVRSNPDGQLGFLRDLRRTNVAMTRARRQLILVLNGDTLGGEPYYRQLLATAERDGGLEDAEPSS